ncbi:MAG: RsmB/NOP family class I SAM-dependent RNA methyltransferase [Parerythrobacter sp.]
MTPAARVQSAIGILDLVIAASHAKGAPADRIVGEWAKNNRYAGSKDRRAIRELVYGAIRACGPVPKTGRAAMLRLAESDATLRPLFDGSQYGPAAIVEGEPVAKGGIAPVWLVERLAASSIEGDEAAALLDRAPLDVRVNTLKAARDAVLLPEQGEPLAAPNALRLPTGKQIAQWPAYRDGHIEVQDHGSQWACAMVGARPGETVIDLCAGAGGKTLALAAAMKNTGTLVASDTDRGRLSRLTPRAERAGATNIASVLLNPGREAEALANYRLAADAVLVDAPCSGTGTWRRNPESRWRLTADELARYVLAQARLLDLAATLVKPGGRLVYVTCSLLDEEGAEQIAHFLDANPEWRIAPRDCPIGQAHGRGRRLTPYHDGTDGFFIACLTSP